MRETPTDATTLNSFARAWSVAISSHNVDVGVDVDVDVGDLADAAGDNADGLLIMAILSLMLLVFLLLDMISGEVRHIRPGNLGQSLHETIQVLSQQTNNFLCKPSPIAVLNVLSSLIHALPGRAMACSFH